MNTDTKTAGKRGVTCPASKVLPSYLVKHPFTGLLCLKWWVSFAIPICSCAPEMDTKIYELTLKFELHLSNIYQ